MLKCTECGREFISRGSLNRHSRNHRKTAIHTCPTCSVTFLRRDLLTRHMKLHGTAGDPDDRVKGPRKRCHTACIRCRDLKIKCDGQVPCTKCSSVDKACQYDQKSNRLSRVTRANEIVSPAASGISPGSRQSSPQGCFGDPVDQAPQCLSPNLSHPCGAVFASGHELPSHHVDDDINDTSHPDIGHIAAMGGVGLESVQDPGSGSFTSWPWLHESLFMSNNIEPVFGSFDMECLNFGSDNLADMPLMDLGIAGAGSNEGGTETSITIRVDGASNSHQSQSSVDARAEPDGSMQLSQHGIIPSAEPTLLVTSTTSTFPSTSDAPVLRLKLVEELISQAFSAKPRHRGWWADVKASLSVQLSKAFSLPLSKEDADPSSCLQYFLQLYLQNFYLLWPLIPRRDIDSDHVHPVLFLVMTSIGAMFAKKPKIDYGTMMHNALRIRLDKAIDLEDIEHDYLWLAQSRLLTQVAALYFGQPKAFSYSQHLGALLIAQARRMSLYSADYTRIKMAHFHRMKGLGADADRLRVWMDIETRRRLAFGIFRGDTFTSILLNTKPLITLDEIDMEFPRCDAVWTNGDLDPRVALGMIDHDRSPGRSIMASDTYHLLLDRGEQLPVLEPVGHELLLFGLQLAVWRFSLDRSTLQRLSLYEHHDPDGTEALYESDSLMIPPSSRKRRRNTTSEADSLAINSRNMADLSTEQARTSSALAKWERSLPITKAFVQTEQDRCYILSGLILYHLSHLRLHAPVNEIHQIQYRLADRQSPDPASVGRVRAWANSSTAQLAVERASAIWSLIDQEAKSKSSFNLLALISLHHGAAVLWAYLGGRSKPSQTKAVRIDSNGESVGGESVKGSPCWLLAHGAGTAQVLKAMIDLHGLIFPDRWTSFVEATKLLCQCELPQTE